MALLPTTTMIDRSGEQKGVHSFFQRRPKSIDSQLIAVDPTPTGGPSHALVPSEKNLEHTNTSKAPSYTNGPGSELHEVDLNHERRKRRKPSPTDEEAVSHFKTAPSAQIHCGNGIITGAGDFGDFRAQIEVVTQPGTGEYDSAKAKANIPLKGLLESQGCHGGELPVLGPRDADTFSNKPTGPVKLAEDGEQCANAPVPAKPKKLLQFNPKTGTIGSPPAKKPSGVPDGPTVKKAANKRNRSQKSFTIMIGYGTDSEAKLKLGQKIDNILHGRDLPAAKASPTVLATKAAEVNVTSKSTHPFFLGKLALKVPPLDTPMVPEALSSVYSRTESLLEDIAPKTEARRPRTPIKPASLGISGGFHAFGNGTKTMKIPGAVDPIWPPESMMHVRGHGIHQKPPSSFINSQPKAQRKAKNISSETTTQEDVLELARRDLNIPILLEDLGHVDLDHFQPAHPVIRVPQRHFESGSWLQRKVRTGLMSNLRSHLEEEYSSEDELQNIRPSKSEVHPAVTKLYNSIATSLAPHDKSQSETRSWLTKYAPTSTAGVLQTGREPFILRDWLQALTVTNVETGNLKTGESNGTHFARSKPKSDGTAKRKRKPKLDSFIVDSDEEGNDMDEISEPEGGSPHGSQGISRRTVVRVGNTTSRDRNGGKLANAIVISGPNGCGKTAMVYAVAKELGFDIFEINSSSRRSGKDILERVGDMTQNHQVHNGKGTVAQDDDLGSISVALAADLESGRQGTMNSFFKPKTAKAIVQQDKKKSLLEEKPRKKAPPKPQKQSLILLEEVDVLFEEDKQFWATVMSLIMHSKRPIIMTCNDETLVPLQALSLHAILRLSPPPVDIAVDYLMAMVANEGHIIQREPIETLYEAYGCDLRASIMELDFWCQIGVGDRRGGQDWFYSRWPPGSDIDQHGHTVRVISEGTYETGMAWLSRDRTEEKEHLEKNEEARHQLWNAWSIYPSYDFNQTFPDQTYSASLNENYSQLNALSSFQSMAEAKSVADICSFGGLASNYDVLLDSTRPEMSHSSRDDFICGLQLLQVDEAVTYGSVHTDIAFWLQSYASLQLDPSRSHEKLTASRIEKDTVRQILHRKSDDNSITRQDFSFAFDPIAAPERIAQQLISSLEPSVFDRTTTMIATEVAPYVRSIVAFDMQLQRERAKFSNLLSEGGRSGKRVRTTRSALSALQGGTRKTTRRDKYFEADLNFQAVMRTGMDAWDLAAREADVEEASGREESAE